jgi:c-di-GMP-binding flagellar brake protein YcgR
MKKLPIPVGGVIFLRPLQNQSIQAKSFILGAKHGDFLIIEQPIVRYSERLFAKVSGDVICRYEYEGEVYDFTSSIRKSMNDGLTLIDYPSEFEVHALRKFPRIRVNIETIATLEEDADNTLNANMIDISEGGCQLIFNSLQALAQNALCFLDFSLPDKCQIRGLKAKITKVSMSKLETTTKVGVQFLGPPDEMEKITSFCHFCSFFEV